MGIPGVKGLSVKAFGKRFYQRFLDNDLSGIAAELSYYFLFSIFPFLVFLVALAGDRSEFRPPSFWTVASAPVAGLTPAGWRGRPRARHHLSTPSAQTPDVRG